MFKHFRQTAQMIKMKGSTRVLENQKTNMKTIGSFAASPLHYLVNQLLLTSSQQY